MIDYKKQMIGLRTETIQTLPYPANGQGKLPQSTKSLSLFEYATDRTWKTQNIFCPTTCAQARNW